MIKQEDLEHLAKLARIKLTEEDKKSLVKEFDSILTYVDQLKKVDVSMDAEGRVGAVKNVMREDVVSRSEAKVSDLGNSEEREALLNEAPHRVDDFIAVKKIIEQ
jgi:aspartyl-tRNA(Asn)/glutamyl-tRNA(Gln) amidotransferase subunit C